MKTSRILTALLFVILLAAPCMAQTKTAVINTRDVLTKCDLGAQAVKDIEAKFSDRSSKLIAMRQEVAKLDEKVKSKADKPAKTQELQDKMAKLQQEDQKFRQELNQEQAQLAKPIIDKLTVVLNEYAKEKGIQAIQERSAYLYVDPSLDITDEIIKRVNQAK